MTPGFLKNDRAALQGWGLVPQLGDELQHLTLVREQTCQLWWHQKRNSDFKNEEHVRVAFK